MVLQLDLEEAGSKTPIWYPELLKFPRLRNRAVGCFEIPRNKLWRLREPLICAKEESVTKINYYRRAICMNNIRVGTCAVKRGGSCNSIPVRTILVAARYCGSSYSLTIAIAGHIKRYTMSNSPRHDRTSWLSRPRCH